MRRDAQRLPACSRSLHGGGSWPALRAGAGTLPQHGRLQVQRMRFALHAGSGLAEQVGPRRLQSYRAGARVWMTPVHCTPGCHEVALARFIQAPRPVSKEKDQWRA